MLVILGWGMNTGGVEVVWVVAGGVEASIFMEAESVVIVDFVGVRIIGAGEDLGEVESLGMRLGPEAEARGFCGVIKEIEGGLLLG